MRCGGFKLMTIRPTIEYGGSNWQNYLKDLIKNSGFKKKEKNSVVEMM